jgi:polyketide synthase PksN
MIGRPLRETHAQETAMIDQGSLRDLTESYLKSVIADASGSLDQNFDSLAAFGELGINSFYVLKIIKKLEADFGRLPKSLLFENFTICDLASYFVDKHEQILSLKFAEQLRWADPTAHSNGNQRAPKPVGVVEGTEASVAKRDNNISQKEDLVRILEKEAYAHPEFRELVQSLFARYKSEGCVSRGTRRIAPNLFIGSARRGYCNYGRSKNIILLYGYTGPRDYLPALVDEVYRYCETKHFQLNILADEDMQSIGDIRFSATPFGAMQRILNLQHFALEGGAMRRLRYQVSKFQKSGACRTEEYRGGGNAETDKNIAIIIDRWCAARAIVNPLVYDVKGEILAGKLPPEHRLFLTHLDDVLQNVILITEMSTEKRGYLMDLEFYPPNMPMGGLEFAIARIIEVLVAEGCDVLSLGGTYGCKLNPSANADPEIDKILDDLREQNIFNDDGNLQFKNKFRPENKTIFLCRPLGRGNPDNVIDVIMMIADPEKMQTSDEENHNASKPLRGAPTPLKESATPEPSAELSPGSSEQVAITGNERSRILSQFGFNPLNIPHEHIEFDLKTDSWAQLEMPEIDAQMRHLHAQLQQPVNVDDSLRSVFPFSHFVLTGSGQQAEHLLFKAWPNRGIVPQNVLFPSTIFHQIDNGFTPRELPHPEIFQARSLEQYQGNMAWEALQSLVAQDPAAIAFACIELSNNAAGGRPVSIRNIKDVKRLLAERSIPLVVDVTRVLENARFLIEQEKEYAEKSVWTAARELMSQADVAIGSLSKDFCVKKGGIIATNDVKLFRRLQEMVREEGAGIDLIDQKMIALALQNRKQIDAKVLRRMEGVRLLWRDLKEHNVPVAELAGGHCVLIDIKQIPEFEHFDCPVASFVAWMYLNTGIRTAAHSVGMQKNTPINDLVRLAVPVGLKREQISCLTGRLVRAFDERVNIPEIILQSKVPQPFGEVYGNYKLVRYHRRSESVMAPPDPITVRPHEQIYGAPTQSAGQLSPTTNPAQESPLQPTVAAENVKREVESSSPAGASESRRRQDIAIVGMAGRYPKAKNLGELWENLAQGRDCIEEISADRHEGRLLHGSDKKHRGGFIDDVDKFDSLFFNISPREAEMLDPQERLFLEVAWEAIEDAGYYPEMLVREDGSRDVGVFVGAVWAMYQMLGVEEKHLGNNVAPNSFLWSIANRVSYWMNFSGPSLTLDTACSSSLTAVHLACEAIQAGDCSAAIVGGVNLDLHQAKLEINKLSGALSVDGVCRSFGLGANGYVAGEGIGALFLKPLDRAAQNGDHIYAVIKSAVVNHGGRTSGYTVPNPKAQTNLIVSALAKADIDARSIGYIEAHGTGTELGDPIEITGLTDALSRNGAEHQTCAIGSIKSNIGHLEAAAGVASISKVLLQIKHRRLVPSLHSAELNQFIDFEHSPFYVVQHLEEWKPKEIDGVRLPLRAGISSFGAGGSNAHVILESYEPVEQASDEPLPAHELTYMLSARNEDQLREAAVRLSKFLRENRVDLHDVAFTLQMGKKSFEQRLAVIAKTKEELLEKLACFIAGKKAEGIFAGHIKSAESLTRLLNRREKEEFIRLLSQSRDQHRLAELWVEGLLTDGQGFRTNGSGKRVSLPTYPFADKRHWICKKPAIHNSFRPAGGMHPLVDTNESTFERQLFKKTFHERDFFIYDHRVSEIPTLPGVAYLELARKAGEVAAGRPVRKIRNILWVSPIAIHNSTPKEVFIELKPSGDTVQFEVVSHAVNGTKTLHSQGKLLYATKQELDSEPEYIDLIAIRARCAKCVDGNDAYPLFKSVGLNLGPSFQVLHEVYKNDREVLGVLKLPEFRQGDLQSMTLHPSLVDGSLQAGMAAQLGEAGEMLVPYSIGEVEILHPLQSRCFSYVTKANEDRKDKRESRVLKSNVLIVDETGKILVKIRESTGVPLLEIHSKSEQRPAIGDGFSPLYYSYEWESAPLVPEDAKRNKLQPILLFDTEESLRDLYRGRLKEGDANSGQIILVRPGESFCEPDKDSYSIRPQNKDDFKRLFESLAERNFPLENICFAWPLRHAGFSSESLLRESLERGVSSFLFLCQALIQLKLESKVQLLYLYSGKPGQTQPQHEAVTGFINTLRIEHSRLLCKTLEMRQENASYEEILDAVSAELRAHTQDATAVRYEEHERYRTRLKAFDLEVAAGSAAGSTGLKEKGSYLITGGAGGLGLIFAGFLAKEYKARLILTGRSELSGDCESKLDELRRTGAEIIYLPADVSHREEVQNLINASKSRFGEINGIIHAAGAVRDSYLRNKTLDEMSAVFAPKVYGTLHLDEATKNEALDFFITFSSLAAVTGNAGQCDYSYANYFMDAFAAGREQLRARGFRFGKTLSINWSLWASGGMRPDEQTEIYFKNTLGIRPLNTATGIEAFKLGLASGRSRFAVIEGIQEKMELAWGLKKRSSAVAAAASPVSSDQPAGSFSRETDGDLLPRLQNDLSQIVMDLLKLDLSDMSVDKILLDLGFDSIGLTTFANAVNEKYQLDITPVLFFDYPSIREIAQYLSVERESEIRQCYGGSAAQAAAQPSDSQPLPTDSRPAENQPDIIEIKKGWKPTPLDGEVKQRPSREGYSPELRFINDPIAIVGMSGVMPQSEDLEAFWENLKNGKDMVTVIPRDRWRWEDYYGDPLKEANKSNSKWGGFINEVDKFDPMFFGISPREAQAMDPQQRIFLETVWKAIEDSGQKVSDLSGTRTGLFVGVGTNDYIDVITNLQVPLDAYTASGNSHSVLANRVSFLLNLRGPSAPLDTACSSSLVAMHRAIESIHSGSCDMAIVGGVQVMLSPGAYISFGMAGMLSGDGKCKTFDKRANGYVRGEGSGAVFLKRLSAAEAEGNHIYAVVRATAENHGGRVTTLTAPNSAAQTELLIQAYEKAQIDPATVGYIECHGTGTSLGDPIEIQSLSKAFSELYKRRKKAPAETPHCGLSSVKTNIGHLETAAGIAGVLKVLLSIQHKQIPANIHFEEMNPYINLKGTPFYIADKLTPWEAPAAADGSPIPRRAGVSSFGFGGANAHVVLEEYIPPNRQPLAEAQGPQLIVLSAKNEDRLKAYIQAMHAYLDKAEVELTDFAYTLQVGRDEMPERLAVVVSSSEELKKKLEAIFQGGESPLHSYRGTVRNTNNKDTKSLTAINAVSVSPGETPLSQDELSRLAELWVSGSKIDWRTLYKSGVPRRISIPTYPFAKERYWIASGESVEERSQTATMAELQLHPLIHRNISTLKEQKFSSRFKGTEFFLEDHRIRTEPVLPAVAYIEMVAAAGELSGDQKICFIRNMVWLAPLTVGNDGKEVEVSLSPGKGEVEFVVRSRHGGRFILHCRGKLAYRGTEPEPDTLNVPAIKERCSGPMIAGKDLYPFLSTSELNLGKSFQVVQRVYAGQSECLAVLQLPEHLKNAENRFWLHPALLDGAVHTAIGLVKKSKPIVPWSVPYSVGEIQIVRSLKDVYYAHASWDVDCIKDPETLTRIDLHLLDRDGQVLVRMKDFVSKPFAPATAKENSRKELSRPKDGNGQEDAGNLQSFVPVWNAACLERTDQKALPQSTKVLLLGGNQTHLDWARKSCPKSQRLESIAISSIDIVEQKLAGCSFDQLIWVAPDVKGEPACQGEGDYEELIIEQQEQGVLAVFRIIKALLNLGYAAKKLRWTIIISRAQRVTEVEVIHPAHAGLVGLVGSLAKEYSNWNLRLLDVDSLASVTAQECLTLPWDKHGNVLAHRQGEWFEQRLALMPNGARVTPAYRQNGVYVVIGGAGGLGQVWSRYLIENYQANIVWIGRRDYDSTIEEKINSLIRMGRAPLYISADATNLALLEQARNRILQTYPAIHGVVHSAIVLHDLSLARMDESAFRSSYSAKVDIAVNMDRVFGKRDLDLMLFFSSIVSFFKTPGQSNYAAGCTFKDSFAQMLQQERAYPVKIMNWGYWGSVGVVADEFHKKLMAQVGIGSIEAEEGMAALEGLIGSETGQLALIKTLHNQVFEDFGLSDAFASNPQEEPMGLLQVERDAASGEAELATMIVSDAQSHEIGRQVVSVGGNGRPRNIIATAIPRQPSANATRTLAETRGGMGNKDNGTHKGSSPISPTEQTRDDSVQQVIIEKLSEALKMATSMIGNDSPFADYGVDSIIGVNLVRAINEALTIDLEPTKLFEYSTVTQLSEYISANWQITPKNQPMRPHGVSEKLSNASTEMTTEIDERFAHRFIESESVVEPQDTLTSGQGKRSSNGALEPIAIIGMSGRFAESETLDEFWQNLKQGKDLVKDVSRWTAADCVTTDFGHGYCRQGSYIDSADKFDPSFFGISSLEAVHMDPQQRLFLEESWKALEDSGYAGKSVREKQCGVYVGCGTSNYADRFTEEPPPQAWWGNSQSIAPARISYYLNLQGPAIAVDTACSSGLVAIHLACQALWSGETVMALAGGVYVQATSAFHQVANRAGMLSPEGKCYSFDARANGFVPGEAVGALVLKRLSDALKDGDHIHAVIAGSGINQNGSSNGLIAPNARAQERLELSVYDRFNINPETIQFVEAHGTGTIVGDSIEHLAITRAFREFTDKKQFCAMGSVKTNLGHAGAAAGIASVMKLVLSLKQRQIPPSLHFHQGNPAINFESSPFYVNTQLEEWAVGDNQKRRGAVSSFGFSGTNAHLIIEEPPSLKRTIDELPGYVVALSARTPEQLKQQVRRLLKFIESGPDLSMNDLSFSLFVGRMHLAHRLSCVSRTQKDLLTLLGQWMKTGSASQVYTSEVQDGRIREHVSLKKFGNYCVQECKKAPDDASYLENLAVIADLYVKGYGLDFDSLFPPDSKRIPLPTYPFAMERYWIESEGAAKRSSMAAATATLVPSPHAGTPSVVPQNDGSAFTGQDSVAPRNDTENQLVEIWAQLLDLAPEKIGVDDNLFALGGNSLLATQLISKIRSRLGVHLPLTTLFEQTTIAQLAESVTHSAKSDVPLIRPINRAQFERLPLSFAQERVWFFEQLEPGSARYNVYGAVVICGALDVDQLDQAFNLVIARHESLRTIFPSHEGQAQQLILDSLSFKVERFDLSDHEAREAHDRKAKELCQADAATPFDLARGPLIRAKVIELAEHEHVLMLNMHHIVSDGWSMGVLIKELSLTLEALRQDRRPQLAPLPIQYVDYSVWQRKWLEEGGILKRQLAYWSEKLAALPDRLDLPTDYPRPSAQGLAGAMHPFVLDTQLTGQLRRLAEHKGGTLFMILLAAIKVLLHRYTDQNDICVGTLIANRQYGETEELIGMFVNTLALRSQVEGEDTFSALLSQVKTTCLEAYEHQDAPFEKVIHAVRSQSNAATTPIFQVMLILQNADMGALDQRFTIYPLESGICEFDLAVQFTETSEGLDASIDYSTSLYKRETIVRMAEHLVELCRAITAKPAAKVRDLDYVGQAERRKLLIDFNDTQADYPQDKCIHELFAEQAVIEPERTAAVVGGQELTYQQLHERSRDLALYLQSQGVAPDSVVGLCLEPSLEMMVGVLGILQAGGAYAALDPTFSEDRLAYLLQDSNVAIVLTQDEFTNKLQPLLPSEAKLIILDKQWAEVCKSVSGMKDKGQELRRDVTPRHASYVAYVTGKTGKPKGVLVDHKALVNRIYGLQKHFPLDHHDVLLPKMPCSSDSAVWEVFWPLIAGASVAFASPGRQKDIPYLEALLENAKVTTLHCAPSMLDGLLDLATKGCGSVKRILCSGEPLDERAVNRCKARFPNSSLHNLYGAADGAIDATAFDCSHLNHSFVPIGTPIANTRVYILDRNNHPQPIGVPGELHIAGDGLARGYVNHPELTKKKFIANPFLPGTRMFKTGEMARWLDDGNIQHMGVDRRSSQK